MSLDDLPPELAEELEILAFEATRRGPGVANRLQRDITALIRRHRPNARVRVERQGRGLLVRIAFPDATKRVREIRLQLGGD